MRQKRQSGSVKSLIITLTCVLTILFSIGFVSFADTETGTHDGYPYTFYYYRGTTSQDEKYIETTFKWQLRHYSRAIMYVGSNIEDDSTRKWVTEGNKTSSASASSFNIYSYGSPYWGH